ncbi:hypothetical protein Dimus_030092 [Dionaea muscipula]
MAVKRLHSPLSPSPSPSLSPHAQTTQRMSFASLRDPALPFPLPNAGLVLPLSTHRRHCHTLSLHRNVAVSLSSASSANSSVTSSSFKWPPVLIKLSASSLFLFSLGVFAFSSSAFALTSAFPGATLAAASTSPAALEEGNTIEDKELEKTSFESAEEKDLNEAFEIWKSKTFALTVPLRVVALRGSVPASWIKDFIQSQGRRLKFQLEVRASLEEIFNEVLTSFKDGNVHPRSAITADLITVGDSWLSFAIKHAIIEPIQMPEDKDWFRGLPQTWKIYLRKNDEGLLDPKGRIWGIPYRWGSMVIMYKKNKFDKYGLQPIQDWEDLWRPELAGRIAMVDSAREIVGAVLKYMGASYNTKNIDTEVSGGIKSVQQNLAVLANQVRLFDSTQYLKAFSIGDVWVAVGWSSDILPAAKRLSDVAVVVPKSGTSLWADLWAVPSTPKSAPEKIGGRIRGPSPLIHQWLDFCLQPGRELPFKQEVVPGASPSSLECPPTEPLKELTKGPPKLETNLIAGVPPPEILERCEFLNPLSEDTLAEYRFLISSMRKPVYGLIQSVQHYISTLMKLQSTK